MQATAEVLESTGMVSTSLASSLVCIKSEEMFSTQGSMAVAWVWKETTVNVSMSMKMRMHWKFEVDMQSARYTGALDSCRSFEAFYTSSDGKRPHRNQCPAAPEDVAAVIVWREE